MTLRKQLESLSQQLASFHDEQLDRFDQTLFAIREAHSLALQHNQSAAADIARHVTGLISPGEGRVVIAAMIASLPADSTDLFSVTDVCELLAVSPATVAEWIESKQLRASNLSKSMRPRWVIRRSDLERFLEFRQG